MRTRSGRVWMAGALALAAMVVSGCNREPGASSGDIGLNSSAGSVVVQCDERDFATLTGFEPAAGYVGRIVVQGPSKQVSILFESGSANDIRVAVHCVKGAPKLEEFNDEDENIITSLGSSA